MNDSFGLTLTVIRLLECHSLYDAIDFVNPDLHHLTCSIRVYRRVTSTQLQNRVQMKFHGSVGYYYTDDSFAGDNNGDEEFNLDFEALRCKRWSSVNKR